MNVLTVLWQEVQNSLHEPQSMIEWKSLELERENIVERKCLYSHFCLFSECSAAINEVNSHGYSVHWMFCAIINGIRNSLWRLQQEVYELNKVCFDLKTVMLQEIPPLFKNRCSERIKIYQQRWKDKDVSKSFCSLETACGLVPGKERLLQHLIESSALCLSSYLQHISRIVIISFFSGAKVIAPCCIWCEDLQTCHHKSWNGTHTRRIGVVPWGLRTVLMGWNSKE